MPILKIDKQGSGIYTYKIEGEANCCNYHL